MRQIALGNGEITASQVALGIMRMGKKSVEDATTVLKTVYDQGVNFFDSADIYTDGESELVFGKALKNAGIPRDKVYIQSKAGIVLDHARTTANGLVFGQRYDFSKEFITSCRWNFRKNWCRLFGYILVTSS